jgi:hypothetical protein
MSLLQAAHYRVAIMMVPVFHYPDSICFWHWCGLTCVCSVVGATADLDGFQAKPPVQ